MSALDAKVAENRRYVGALGIGVSCLCAALAGIGLPSIAWAAIGGLGAAIIVYAALATEPAEQPQPRSVNVAIAQGGSGRNIVIGQIVNIGSQPEKPADQG